MRRTGLAVLVLLALAGLAMGVQAQGDDGLVANGISMRIQGMFLGIVQGTGMMG